jgi:excisionase family DNA binding protein
MSTVGDRKTAGGLPELLDVTQVAAYLGLHRVTVLGFAREGKLPAFKVGREWRFRAEDIRAWLEEQRRARDAWGERFDRLWERLRRKAEAAGYGPADVPRLIREVRRAQRRRSTPSRG